MARDSEYNALKQDFRKKEAEVQDLRETAREKEIVWRRIVKETQATEKLARELCTLILAKDRSEMVLGREYSWDTENIDDLIKKAINSYKARLEMETEMLRKRIKESDDKDGIIERLENNILRLRNNGGLLLPDSEDDEYDPVAEAQAQIAEEQNAQSAIEDLPPSVRQGFNEGRLDVKVVGTKGESKDTVTEDEKENFYNSADKAAQVEAETAKTASLPHSDAEELKKEHDIAKKERRLAHTINLNDLIAQTDDFTWKVYDAIGGAGHSRVEMIVKHINSSLKPNERAVNDTKVNRALKAMVGQAAVNNKHPENPLSPNLLIYRLTDTGKQIYEAHFNKEPVLSEWERVVKEHDNVDHGYSIIFLAEMMRAAGWYDKVIESNRSHAIKVSGGQEYICDILGIKKKNGKEIKDYWEYERNTHNQNNFNAKCNKMMQVTRDLNFIVTNRKIADGLKIKVDEWIRGKKMTALQNIRVNICTAKDLRDRGIQDEQWMIYHYTFTDGVNVTRRNDPATE